MQSDCLNRAVRGLDDEEVRDEIEINLKVSTFVRHGRCCKSARCNIQGNVPPVIQQWGEFETDFAYYLGPHIQRFIGILPLSQRQFWPCVWCCSCH